MFTFLKAKASNLISSGPGREVDGVGDVLFLGEGQQEVDDERGLARARGAHQQDRDLRLHHLVHEVTQASVLVC